MIVVRSGLVPERPPAGQFLRSLSVRCLTARISAPSALVRRWPWSHSQPARGPNSRTPPVASRTAAPSLSPRRRIHSLSSRLDDVIDGIEDAVHRMVAFRLDPITPTVIDLCKHIVTCVNSLKLAFEALHSNKKLNEHCIEINRVEEVVDILVRDAVKKLFENEKDPITLIKLKEIYEFLEQTTDYCEDVADALQNVVVKNS